MASIAFSTEKEICLLTGPQDGAKTSIEIPETGSLTFETAKNSQGNRFFVSAEPKNPFLTGIRKDGSALDKALSQPDALFVRKEDLPVDFFPKDASGKIRRLGALIITPDW